jgi:hypothetical protein
LAADVLDLDFETGSPIPSLHLQALAGSGDTFVSLPPLHLLEPGNQDLVGLVQLVTLARAIDARQIFEIGTYNGLTALTLATNLSSARIDTLDLPAETQPQLPLFHADRGNRSDFHAHYYDGRPEADRIVQHHGDSALFDVEQFRGTVDLVYVDGAHSVEYVENDTRIAFELVKPTGVVVWDDYWRVVPDVSAVLHSLELSSLYRLPGTRLVTWLSPPAHERLVRHGVR